MAINLQKGQRQTLSAPKFTVGLGWDTQVGGAAGADFDLDASVFLLRDTGKLVSDSFFVFYNNLASPDGAVTHTGDNRTGEGDGDDEQIVVDLSTVDPRVHEISIVVTIHDAEKLKQNFGQVRNAFIRIVDAGGAELMRYDLDEDFSVETAVQFGRIYRRGDEWKFGATGTGMKGGLEDYLAQYN